MGLAFQEATLQKDTKFKLPEILVKTFIKQIDNNLQFTAIDICHCAGAVLEYPEKVSEEILKQGAFKSTTDGTSEERAFARVANREDNFWAVYHDMLNEDPEYLKKSVQVAIDFQISVVNEGKTPISPSKADHRRQAHQGLQ